MKILSIRIKNLASLSGEHFIDFESEPLANAGLIAIIGKTGAGKSTILDAMCLALFNQVPRLKGSDGKLIDVDGSELLSNSPLTVLRRGTGHGFAELCFVAQDQKHYLARWEIKRARENAVGKLQSVQRSLKCLSDGVVIADKSKAVEASIVKITQLSFEQFTRAVLLAQSEVTAFLKARDNERGALLEYLTNSNIFAKIGELAYEKTKTIANQRKELENVLGHLEILSDEAVTELTAQLQHSHAQYQSLSAEHKTLEQQQLWFAQQQKLDTDLQQRQHHLNLQQQQLEQLAPARMQLKQLEVFAAIRPSVMQQHKVSAERHTLQTQLQSTAPHFTALQQAFQAEEKQFQELDAQLKIQQAFEHSHQHAIDQVRSCIQAREFIGEQFQKTQATLQQFEQQQQPLRQQQAQLQCDIEILKKQQQQHTEQLQPSAHFSNLDDGLSAHLSQLQRFIQQVQAFEQQFGNLHSASSALEDKQQQLQSVQQQFCHHEHINLSLSQQRHSREQKLQQVHALGLIQNQIQQFKQVRTEQKKIQAAQQDLSHKIEQATQQQQRTQQDYLLQKQQCESLQQVLQQQRLLHTENIEKLREQLLDGTACLVCGSTQHPFKQGHTALSHELLNLQQQQQQQAIQLEKSCFDTWQKAQQQLTAYNSTWAQNIPRLAALSEQSTQLEAQIQHALQHTDLAIEQHVSLENLHPLLLQSVQTLQHDIDQLDHSLLKLTQAEKQQRNLLQEIQQIQQHLSVIQQLEHTIDHIVHALNAEQKQAWQMQTTLTAQKIAQQLHQRLKLLHSAETWAQQLNLHTQALQQFEQNIAFKNEQIKATQTERAALEAQGQKNKELAIQLIFQMTQQQVEKPQEWLLQYEQQRKHLQMQFNHIRQSFDQSRQQFEQQQRQREQLTLQLQQLQLQQSTLAFEIQQWLNQQPDFNADLLRNLYQIADVQQHQMRLSLRAAERSFSDAQAALQAIQQQEQQHQASKPPIEWAQLHTEMAQRLEQLQRTSEMKDGFKLKLEVHQRTIEKQKQFADQIQMIQSEEHRWSKISGLMGDAHGKKFRDYAQQYNLDILLEHANQQLAMLSQRYTLKRLNNSLSLAIVDHDMDGETRSVASLSGGESFLTALALSLAIANMAAGSMKIESLFIDEGFGTLDASSLHMVMNALDQLQSQGRKVVLISHIQEMHERIPVQIQVQPMGAGASRIQIVG